MSDARKTEAALIPEFVTVIDRKGPSRLVEWYGRNQMKILIQETKQCDSYASLTILPEIRYCWDHEISKLKASLTFFLDTNHLPRTWTK